MIFIMDHKHRLQELDALRGIAALSVLLFHFTINQNAKKLGWQFSYGVTGVDIFFMISGFVIFLTIHKVKSWKEFAIFRFARLYPTYWACMLLTIIFILLYDPVAFDPVQIAANLTMFPAFFGIEDLDGSYWTLVIELIFYLWILVIYLTKNLKNIVQIGFFFTVGIIAFHYFNSYYLDFYLFTQRKLQLINHFPLFLSGILFYNLKFKSFSFRDLALIFFCLAAAFYLHDKGGRARQVISATEHDLILIFYHLTFALFIFGKLTFLIRPPLLFLGKISYSLYLLHQYIGLHLINTFNETLHLNIYLAIISTILICIGLAYLVTIYVETPAISHIKNWYKSRENKYFENNEKEAMLP